MVIITHIITTLLVTTYYLSTNKGMFFFIIATYLYNFFIYKAKFLSIIGVTGTIGSGKTSLLKLI